MPVMLDESSGPWIYWFGLSGHLHSVKNFRAILLFDWISQLSTGTDYRYTVQPENN